MSFIQYLKKRNTLRYFFKIGSSIAFLTVASSAFGSGSHPLYDGCIEREDDGFFGIADFAYYDLETIDERGDSEYLGALPPASSTDGIYVYPTIDNFYQSPVLPTEQVSSAVANQARHLIFKPKRSEIDVYCIFQYDEDSNGLRTNFQPVPILSAFSPLGPFYENSNPNLIMKYAFDLEINEGNIYIYSDDDTLIETIYIHADNISDSDNSSHQVTLPVTSTLLEDTEYYVLIDNGVFKEFYATSPLQHGISDKNIWRFSVKPTVPDTQLNLDTNTPLDNGIKTTNASSANAASVFAFEIDNKNTTDTRAIDIQKIVLHTSGNGDFSKINWQLSDATANHGQGVYDADNHTLTFSNLTMSVANGTRRTYTLSGYFNDTSHIADNSQYLFSLDDSDFTLDASQAQLEEHAPISSANAINAEVVASALKFTSQPTHSLSGQLLTPQPRVAAVDSYGNIDVDHTGTITLTEDSAGTLGGTTSGQLSNGQVSFSDITYIATSDKQAFILKARDNSPQLLSIETPTIISDLDNTAPLAPTLNPVDNTTGLSGRGEPGARLSVTDSTGKEICTAHVQDDQSWHCTPSVTPAPGTIFNVSQTDASGNVSPITTGPGGLEVLAHKVIFSLNNLASNQVFRVHTRGNRAVDFSFVDPDSDAFTIDVQGQIDVVDRTALDIGAYNLAVQASDGVNTAQASVTIFVADASGLTHDRDDNHNGVGQILETIFTAADTDGDGIPNSLETIAGEDIDAYTDRDQDGTPDVVELLLGRDPILDDNAASGAPSITAPASLARLTSGHLSRFSSTQLEVNVQDHQGTALDVTAYYARGLCHDGLPYNYAALCVPVSEAGYIGGTHRLWWVTTDTTYNWAVAPQVLDLLPSVRLSGDRTLAGVPGQGSITTHLILDGNALAHQSFTVPFSLSGNAAASSYQLSDTHFTIEAGQHRSAPLTITLGDQPIHDSALILTLNTDADVFAAKDSADIDVQTQFVHAGAKLQQRISISQGQTYGPRLTALKGKQGTLEGLILDKTQGQASLQLTLDDPDGGTYRYSWLGSDPALRLDTANTSAPAIDLRTLAAGKYYVQVEVTDSSALNQPVATLGTIVSVVDGNHLSLLTDSDGDGISDAEEGFADSDADGWPNYLDGQNRLSYIVPAKAPEYQSYLASSQPGVRLLSGVTALAAGTGDVTLSAAQLAKYGNLGEAASNTDIEHLSEQPLFNYEVENIDIPSAPSALGNSVAVVLPLEQALSARSAFLHYSAELGWHAFAEDPYNTVTWSTWEAGIVGHCPDAGSDAYSHTPQAKVGANCLQVRTQDGGDNDADKQTNGRLISLLGVADEPLPEAPTLSPATRASGTATQINTVNNGGGGALSLPLFIGLGLAACWRLRRRLALVALLFGASGTQAEVLLSVGPAYQSGDHTPSALSALGYTDVQVSDDTQANAWSAGYRHQLDPHWSLDTTYLQQGKTTPNINATIPADRPPEQAAKETAHALPKRGQGISVVALYHHPWEAGIQLQVGAGVVAWRSERTASVEQASHTAVHNGISPIIQLGGHYALTKEAALELSWQHTFMPEEAVDRVSLGLAWRY